MSAKSFIKRAASPFGPVVTQAAGQGFALLGQSALLLLLGQNHYAPVALALLSAQLAAFIGELGYGRRLMATAASGGNWRNLYRLAIGRRLILLFGLSLLLLGGWVMLRGMADPGLPVLLAALPAIWLSAWDPDPILHGLGKHRLAGLGLVGRWSLFAALILLGGAAAELWPATDIALIAGLALTANFATHISLAAWVGLPLRPLFDLKSRIAGAGALWGAALLGTVYTGMLPFMVEALRPDIAAWALIGLQVLNSAAAMVGRLDRIMLPLLASRVWHQIPYSLLTAIITLLCLIALALLPFFAPLVADPAAVLILAEWQIVACASLLVPLFVDRGCEKKLLLLQLVFLPTAMLAQLFIAIWWPDEIIALLWLRVATAAALLLSTRLLLRTQRNLLSWLALAGLPLTGLMAGIMPSVVVPIALIWLLSCLLLAWRGWAEQT